MGNQKSKYAHENSDMLKNGINLKKSQGENMTTAASCKLLNVPLPSTGYGGCGMVTALLLSGGPSIPDMIARCWKDV